MKTLLMLALALASGPFNAHAQVLIYQGRATLQTSGDGQAFTVPLKNFTVVAPESNHVAQITYDTLPYSSHYGLDQGEVVMTKVSGKNGRQSTIFITAAKSGTRYSQMHYVGADTTLKDNTQHTIQFPRTFKGTHHTLNTANPTLMSDTSVTITYSEKRTIAANAAGKTLDQVLGDLRKELEAEGIYPFSNAAISSSNSTTTSGTSASFESSRLLPPVNFPPLPPPLTVPSPDEP